MTLHAMSEPEARAAQDAKFAARRAVTISLIGASLAAGTVLWGIVLGLRNGNYLLAIWAGVILAGMLIGVGFSWAKHPTLGVTITLTTLWSLLIVASLLASGRGFITATISVVIGGGIALGTLPRRLAVRFVIISVVCGLLSFALDVFGSPDRLAPEVDPIWGTVVALGALLIYGILLVRRFAGFNLGERLLVAAGLVVTVVLAGLLLWTAQRQETQIIAQVDQQARILFDQIVLTRAWIAAQPNGGVYSKVEGVVEPNAYLLQVPGLEVDVKTTSGATYTLRNPALVTRELSELAAQQGLYQFHITSLRPFNPSNQPTDWERTALESFERNEISASLIEKTDQGQVYRYMAPLRVTEACLRCHAQQGYQVGDVRGGLSVMIPMTGALTAIRTNHQQLLLVGVTAVAVMLLVIGIFVRGQVSTPLGKLQQAAVALAQGDLTHEVKLQSHDELGQVSAAFNSMTRQLRDTIGSLEQRVQARTAQLDTSAEVGRAAASILDPEQLLSEVVNLITNRFGYYYAAVFTLDTNGQVAVLREATGDAGRTLKANQHTLSVGGDSMVGSVIATHQARVSTNAGLEAGRYANPLLPETQSEVALPLIVRGRVLGALDVQSTQVAAFDTASVAALQTMADQVAIALSNAQLFEQTQTALIESEAQAQHLAALANLGETLNQAADETAAMQLVDQGLARIVPFEYAAMALLDDTRQQATLRSLGGSPTVLPAQLIIHETHLERALTDRRILSPVDARSDTQPLHDRGLDAIVIAPLQTGRHSFGALIMARSATRPIQERDRNLLQQVASLFAVTLEKLQLQAQTRQAVEELGQVNRRLTAEAWQSFLHSRADQMIRISYGAAAPQPVAADELPADSEQAIVQHDAVTQLAHVTLPISLRGQRLGALRFRTPSSAWNENSQAIIASISNTVAQAAENARLIEQTQRTAQREKQIAQAADKIHRASDLQSILETAVQEIARITGSPEVGIQLGTEQPKAAEANLNGAHQPDRVAPLTNSATGAKS